MKSTRPELLDKLNKATDKATKLAIQRGNPIPLSKDSSLVGKLCIEKTKDGYYDIVTIERKTLYNNLSGFDVAVIVAQRHNTGEFSIIGQVLILEQQFSKHHTDMIHYLNCMKLAQKKKDSDRIFILEDKFQTSELLAKIAKDKLAYFKRVR